MLNRKEAVDIKLWTRRGEIQSWQNVVCIKYDHYKGTRKFKSLTSGQIRQCRETLIFEVNGLEVFL